MTPRRNRRPPLESSQLAQLEFQGAAGGVTGSRYLLRTRRSCVLVDCGMFQGSRSSVALNNARWPVPPAELDAVVLTHAHIDHAGLLPRLVRDGFSGPVHVTHGTRALSEVMLADAAWIQEHDAARATRQRMRRGGRPVKPLYTRSDADAALALMQPHSMGERVTITEDLTLNFRCAGHILGAASVELWIRDEVNQRKLVFSGDIGRRDAPIMPDPDPPTEADVVVMESTYGDRDHRDLQESLDELVGILADAHRDRANVIIPVFAVGRAQELIQCLGELERAGRVVPRTVYLDSPMAINVTELYRDRLADLAEAGRRRLAEPGALSTKRFVVTPTAQESMAINDQRGVIVLAASGMCTGGRIQFHLKHQLWQERNHVVIVGFQARGTTGRALVDGARRVRIMGEEIAVKAKIHTLGGFSAHADRTGLTRWLRKLVPSRPTVVLSHGEARVRESFATVVERMLGRVPLCPMLGDTLIVPRSGDRFELRSGVPVVKRSSDRPGPRRSRGSSRRVTRR